MRIALINPPWMYKRLYTHSIYPPYGVLMIATVLKKQGHEVHFIDANQREMDDAAIQEELGRINPEVLGITVFTDTFAFVERMGPWFRKNFPEGHLVLGGPLVSGAPKELLEAGKAQVAVVNDGFLSTPNLMEALEKKAPLAEVEGLMLRSDDGQFTDTGPAPIMDDMDALPEPDWSFLNVDAYLEGSHASYFKKKRLQRYLSIITTLGCPYRCTFCQVPYLFDGVRRRSPQSVADEIKGYQDKYQIESMYFRDDILFRPDQIATALGETVPGLKWSCLLRADMMKESTVQRMKDGGCAEIRVGLESGHDLVLEQANKKTAVEDNLKCIEVASKVGMELSGFMIVGLPGETEESLKTTERFVRDTGVRVSVHFPLPLPGTPLYNTGREEALITDPSALMRRFSEPQLPGTVLQPPAVNYTDLPGDVLVDWAMRIAEVGRGQDAPKATKGKAHADSPF